MTETSFGVSVFAILGFVFRVPFSVFEEFERFERFEEFWVLRSGYLSPIFHQQK